MSIQGQKQKNSFFNFIDVDNLLEWFSNYSLTFLNILDKLNVPFDVLLKKIQSLNENLFTN